ncbi:MAG: ATP-binding protein, partial [Pseudomonadota bacterium]
KWFDENPQPMMVHDSVGHIKVVNRSLLNLAGWREHKEHAYQVADLLCDFSDQDLRRVLSEAKSKPETSFGAIIRTTGGLRSCQARIFCWSDGDQDLFCCMFESLSRQSSPDSQKKYDKLVRSLSKRDEILQAISEGAVRYLEVDDVDSSAPYLLTKTAEAAQVTRAFVYCNHMVTPDQLASTQIIDYRAPETDADQFVTTIRYDASEFSRWAEVFSQGDLLTFSEDTTSTSQFWSAPCRSAIIMPIFANGTWWGFMGYEDAAAPRSWSSEQEALRIVAGLFGLAVEREAAKNKRQRHEAELTHHARLSVVGEMASGMAHELNQPLAAIVNYSQVAANLVNAPEESALLRETLDKTAYQAKRASDIISRIRNFARKDETRVEVTNINLLVGKALEFVQHRVANQRTEIGFSALPEDAAVSVCIVQIEQVILNLLLNALDSVISPGAVSNKIEVSIDKDGESVGVTVRDYGAGVSEAMSSKLFEPFETSKPHGLGMGLAISRTIIEAHKGVFELETDIEPGAAFRFSLPVVS